MIDLEQLLQEMVDRRSSDLFIKAGARPAMRIDGKIRLADYEYLTIEDMEELAREIMNDEQYETYQHSMEMDLALSVQEIGRFRVNIYKQRGTPAMVMRHVLSQAMSFEELTLPPAVRDLSEQHRGLVLVTGTTGSGKSTTLAAMIDHINQVRECHIVTIEDPIEFLHPDKKAYVSQREVGFDTSDFSSALKRVLRQAPDVILIGEMRDLETIQTAIQSAETGHLVFSTLHTLDAVQTVERIINYFPAYLHPQIRLEMSLTLKGVISQRLLPLKTGKGRVPAIEIMIGTPTISKMLNEGRTLELASFIQDGEQYGMQSFNQSLYKLWVNELIAEKDALANATSPDELKMMMGGLTTGQRNL